MKWAWAALVCLGCGGSPTPYGRLTRFEAARSADEARAFGCELVGLEGGASLDAYATIAPGTIVLVAARGLRPDETGPVELRLGTGTIGPDGEAIFDEGAPLIDRAAVIPKDDHYLDFAIDPLGLWPLAAGPGPTLRQGRFVAELYAEGSSLYAVGAIFSGYADRQAVCVRADIDPLDPRVP